MRAIFVHLSDIHFGQEKDGGTDALNTDAKERLIDDARDEVAKLGGKASGLIVTGDIAYSAKPEEYKLAADYLGRLCDAVGCKRVSVQMVPGNHDIERGKITTALKLVLDAIRDGGHAVLDPILDNKDDRDMLYGRFDAYKDFALDYESELDLSGGFSQGGRIDLAEGRSILFVRLNSALICSKKDDKGKLILGKRQQVLPVKDGQEVVVLTHHPLSWFQDSDEARRYIRKRARVLISGHEHFPSLEVQTVTADRDLMLLAAGATAPDDVGGEFVYKYNIVVFEWDEASDALAVTVNPRTWDEEDTCFCRDDKFMEGKIERQLLSSPNFRRAPKPALQDAANGDPALVQPVTGKAAATINIEIAVEDFVDTGDAKISTEVEADTMAPTIDERMLQLRFFQKLSDLERLKTLIELGALPVDFDGHLDHSNERLFFRMLIKQGKGHAIEEKIAVVEAERGGGSK